MTLTTRFALFAIPSAAIALVATVACSDNSNEPPAQNTATGGSEEGTGGADATGGEGATEAGGTETGGDANGGAAETGGASTSDCTADLGPDNAADFSPKCAMLTTAAGEEPKKNVACTDADPQLCYRTCGPASIGYKTETCTGGVYAEGDCQFPTGVDYSCFGIPDTIDAACPAETPQASESCDVPVCTLCNVNDGYLDSGGSAKVGYCVCREPNADGARTWTCASTTAWPCPMAACCG